MAAVLRGGARSSAKPRTKTPARRPVAAGYAPAKPDAARRVGLSPRITLGAACVAVVVGLIAALSVKGRAQEIVSTIGVGVDRQLGGLGLKVAALTVEGATPMARPDIIRASGLYRDQPIIGLDLEALRRRVEQVGWVKSARVVRMLPDTIVIAVTQRDTLAVWEHGGRSQVIDSQGRPIPEADAGRFADLPLVVGDGANENAPAILSAVRAHPRVMEHLDALVRVDNRRWNLRLKDGGQILLPAVGEDSALIQLDQLDQKSRLLALGFGFIDLRNPDVVAVRPRAALPAGGLAANGA
jgi:cell division protein FtsQ